MSAQHQIVGGGGEGYFFVSSLQNRLAYLMLLLALPHTIWWTKEPFKREETTSVHVGRKHYCFADLVPIPSRSMTTTSRCLTLELAWIALICINVCFN